MTLMSTSPPTWRIPCCALKMKKGWGVTMYCKRPWSSLGKLWPQVAWLRRNCGAKKLSSNRRNKILYRRWRACNKKFKASEPSISKLSDFWRPRLRRPPSKRLAWQIVCQLATRACPEGQVFCWRGWGLQRGSCSSFLGGIRGCCWASLQPPPELGLLSTRANKRVMDDQLVEGDWLWCNYELFAYSNFVMIFMCQRLNSLLMHTVFYFQLVQVAYDNARTRLSIPNHNSFLALANQKFNETNLLPNHLP